MKFQVPLASIFLFRSRCKYTCSFIHNSSIYQVSILKTTLNSFFLFCFFLCSSLSVCVCVCFHITLFVLQCVIFVRFTMCGFLIFSFYVRNIFPHNLLYLLLVVYICVCCFYFEKKMKIVFYNVLILNISNLQQCTLTVSSYVFYCVCVYVQHQTLLASNFNFLPLLDILNIFFNIRHFISLFFQHV